MRPAATAFRTLLAGIALGAAVAAGAAVIYRWVDDEGRTHVSDTVPEKYRRSATRIETRDSEASPEQRRQAEERAAREKAFVEDAARRREAAAAAERRDADRAAIAGAAASAAMPRKRPAQVPTEDTDCDTWWRLYRESVACFAPYRTTRGVLPEAFERCNVVIRPELKCGPWRQ